MRIGIVGAGPAGSTAAYLLVKAGHEVDLFDQRDFPRDKLCGGALSGKTIDLLRNVLDISQADLDELIDFRSHEVEHRYRRFRIIRSKLKHEIALVRRIVYDTYLVYRAIDAGVSFYRAKCDVNIHRHEIIQDAVDHEHDYIIGADGSNSIVRKRLINAGKIPDRFERAVCFETLLPRSKYKGPHHLIFYHGYGNNSYGWLFPNKNALNIGLGGLHEYNKGNFMEVFRQLLNDINVDPDDCNIKGHTIHFNDNAEISWGHILLIGDAAGLVNPLDGEGIYYAHRSAELAARSLNNHSRSPPEMYYDYIVRKKIYPEIQGALRLRRLVYRINHPWGIPIIWFTFRMFGKQIEELLNGYRSYRNFKKV
jgi:geranylgeranyl reductase family protein